MNKTNYKKENILTEEYISKNFKFYDNSGTKNETIDCITVVTDRLDMWTTEKCYECLGLSYDAFTFSQFSTAQKGAHLGKTKKWDELTEIIRKHILMRFEVNSEKYDLHFPLPEVKTLDVTAYEYFDKVNGNSYFAGNITINQDLNDQKKYRLPYQYGYGDHYKDMAKEELYKIGYFNDVEKKDLHYQYFKNKKIIVRYTKHLNCKKRDIKNM